MVDVNQSALNLDTALKALGQSKVMPLIGFLKQGLGKLTFSEPESESEPKEITEIKRLIEAVNLLLADQNTPEHEKPVILQDAVNKISIQLAALQTTTNLGDPQANQFILEAKRTFEGLNFFLGSSSGQWVSAFVNPSGKSSEQKDNPGMMAGAVDKMVVNPLAQSWIDGFESGMSSVFIAQVNAMPEKINLEKSKIVPKDQNKWKPDFLEKAMGEDKYRQFKQIQSSDNLADKPEENIAEKDIAEKIAVFSFEFYYAQVVQYSDMLSSIEQLSLNDPATKARLLKEYGLEAIGSAEGQVFLDNIAQNLGFDHAKDLYQSYQSYQNSRDSISFEKINKAKNDFCLKLLDKTKPSEQDAINKMQALYLAEYTRVKNLPSVENKNNTYVSTLSYVSNEFSGAINLVRRTKNVAGILGAAQPVSMLDKPEEKVDLTQWGPWVYHKLAEFKKSAMEVAKTAAVNAANPIYYSGLAQHGMWIEQNVEEQRKLLRKEVNKLNREKNKKIKAEIKKQFMEMGEMPNENSQEYRAHVLEIKTYFNLQPKDEDALNFELISVLAKIKNKMSDLKEQEATKEKIESRKAILEKSQNTFFGRVKSSVAALFGITTREMKESEKCDTEMAEVDKKIININSEKQDLDEIQKITEKRIKSIQYLQKMTSQELMVNYENRIEDLEKLKSDIHTALLASSSENSLNLAKTVGFQGEFIRIQNNLLLGMKEIVSREPKEEASADSVFDLKKLSDLLKNVEKLEKITVNFELIDLPEQVKTRHTQEIENFKNKLIEKVKSYVSNAPLLTINVNASMSDLDSNIEKIEKHIKEIQGLQTNKNNFPKIIQDALSEDALSEDALNAAISSNRNTLAELNIKKYNFYENQLGVAIKDKKNLTEEEASKMLVNFSQKNDDAVPLLRDLFDLYKKNQNNNLGFSEDAEKKACEAALNENNKELMNFLLMNLDWSNPNNALMCDKLINKYVESDLQKQDFLVTGEASSEVAPSEVAPSEGSWSSWSSWSSSWSSWISPLPLSGFTNLFSTQPKSNDDKDTTLDKFRKVYLATKLIMDQLVNDCEDKLEWALNEHLVRHPNEIDEIDKNELKKL